MLLSESIKQIALLGTSRKTIQPADFPAPLTEYINQINQQQTDPEDAFLQTITVHNLYYKSGIQTTNISDSILPPSNDETLDYLTTESTALLPLVLETDDIYFFKLWLTKANDSNHIVRPEWIPVLFTLTESYPNLKQLVNACCGERGRWVAHFNPLWKQNQHASNEDHWAHGSTLERKNELHRIRTENPQAGIELLKTTWKEENASMRLDFLCIVGETLSDSDEEWLNTLQKDKSQKVKDKAYDLLKRLSNSQLIQLYIETLKQTFQIKKGKALLGLVNSTKIEITPLTHVNPLIWESGIEKLSNIKNISDDVFIVMELLAHIPPNMLEAVTSLNPEELISTLKKDAVGINFMDSLCRATSRFQDAQWAALLMVEFPDELVQDLIPALPMASRIEYLTKHIKMDPDPAIHLARIYLETWPQELAQLIFTHTSKNGYMYSKQFYTYSIQYLTTQTIGALPSIQVDENIERTWSTHKSFITNRLQLKKAILETTF